MRVRGLKRSSWAFSLLSLDVAPHAGAWIETVHGIDELPTPTSHPMRVRGLKP